MIEFILSVDDARRLLAALEFAITSCSLFGSQERKKEFQHVYNVIRALIFEEEGKNE